MVTKICKRGMGEVCCSFLIVDGALGLGNYSCAKDTDIEPTIRERRATASMKAMGDNCSGPPHFTPNDKATPAASKGRADKAWDGFVNSKIVGQYPAFAEYTNKVPMEVFETLFKYAFQAGGIDALDLYIGLEESLKLQSHYAGILNSVDGGTRLKFASVDDWMTRLRKTGTLVSKEKA